ncbi:unnamed protein product [Parajaminaea phylloscopi]
MRQDSAETATTSSTSAAARDAISERSLTLTPTNEYDSNSDSDESDAFRDLSPDVATGFTPTSTRSSELGARGSTTSTEDQSRSVLRESQASNTPARAVERGHESKSIETQQEEAGGFDDVGSPVPSARKQLSDQELLHHENPAVEAQSFATPPQSPENLGRGTEHATVDLGSNQSSLNRTPLQEAVKRSPEETTGESSQDSNVKSHQIHSAPVPSVGTSQGTTASSTISAASTESLHPPRHSLSGALSAMLDAVRGTSALTRGHVELENLLRAVGPVTRNNWNQYQALLRNFPHLTAAVQKLLAPSRGGTSTEPTGHQPAGTTPSSALPSFNPSPFSAPAQPPASWQTSSLAAPTPDGNIYPTTQPLHSFPAPPIAAGYPARYVEQRQALYPGTLPSGANGPATAVGHYTGPLPLAATPKPPPVPDMVHNVVLEGNPDALRSLFETSPDAVADMATLKPCPEAAIKALRSAGLKTDLKAHQSTGLKFLVDSEHRQLPKSVDADEVCLWKVVDIQRDGRSTYVNMATRQWQSEEPRLPRGAILADAMGLGKTLVILALIMTPPDGHGILDATDDRNSQSVSQTKSSQGLSQRGQGLPAPTDSKSSPVETVVKAERQSRQPPVQKRKGVAKKVPSPRKARKVIVIDSDSDIDDVIWSSEEVIPIDSDGSNTDDESDAGTDAKSKPTKRPQSSASRRPTLIVCPLSVLSNWTEQARQHTHLRFGVLYGDAGKDLRSEKDWAKYDFIVTTYDTIKLAFREIAVFKHHEEREATYRRERRELELRITDMKESARQHPEAGSWHINALTALKAQLEEANQQWHKVRLVTPSQGGKTEWRNEQKCLDRLASVSKHGLRGAAATRPRKQSSLRDFVVSDDDSDSEDTDWRKSRQRAKGKGKSAKTKTFEQLTKDELLFVWANVRKKPGVSRVFEENWLRVVLDEAHVVRNRKTNVFGSVTALKAERRIAVTGTPLINSTQDLGSLACFIGVEPFVEHTKLWTSLIESPIKNNVPSGMKLLRSICKSLICLRTKEMKIDGKPLVDLPPVQALRYELELKPQDREFYNRAEDALRRKLKIWIDENQMAEHSASILMFLTRMRQLALDKRLVPDTLVEDIEMSDLTDAERQKMPSALRDLLENHVINGQSCPICHEALTWETKPVILPECGHYAHQECLEANFDEGRRCHGCARAIPAGEKFITLPEQKGEHVEDSGLGDSAKIDALVSVLDTIYSNDPRDKVLVFSNFVGFLKLVQKRLKAEGIPHDTFHGAHNSAHREETLKSFRRPFPADEYYPPLRSREEKYRPGVNSAAGSSTGLSLLEQLEASGFRPKGPGSVSNIPRVLLMSIGAGSVGLNLTAANHVIITDPWWQGAIELQAQDRAHRIGQTKDVKVYRLFTSNTVEDRVALLANEKMKLAAAALGGVQYKGQALWQQKHSQNARLKDIARIFGIGAGSEKRRIEIRDEGTSAREEPVDLRASVRKDAPRREPTRKQARRRESSDSSFEIIEPEAMQAASRPSKRTSRGRPLTIPDDDDNIDYDL